MIYSHHLKLSTNSDRPLPFLGAYHLYNWLLSHLPEELNAQLHSQSQHPISHYLFYRKEDSSNIWIVHFLDDQMEHCLGHCLEINTIIELQNGVQATIIDAVSFPPVDESALISQAAKFSQECIHRFEFRFMSPVIFRQNGRYQIFPSEELILKSMLTHWNFISQQFEVRDEDAYRALLFGIQITDYRLRTTRFHLKDFRIPCFTGSLMMNTKLSPPLFQLWMALVLLAPYCGIGAKTTLGMGGVNVIPKSFISS